MRLSGRSRPGASRVKKRQPQTQITDEPDLVRLCSLSPRTTSGRQLPGRPPRRTELVKTLRADGGLQHRPPPKRLVPPDVLGHLMHRFQLQCPEELWVMMCEVSLDRVEQLLLGSACDLRPTFADENSPVAVRDFGQMPLIVAVWLLLVRPTESVGL